MKYIGTVIKDRFALNSKSEREAVFLHTKDGRFVLRRAGANAFVDVGLNEWIGKTIEVEGELHNGTILAQTIANLAHPDQD